MSAHEEEDRIAFDAQDVEPASTVFGSDDGTDQVEPSEQSYNLVRSILKVPAGAKASPKNVRFLHATEILEFELHEADYDFVPAKVKVGIVNGQRVLFVGNAVSPSPAPSVPPQQSPQPPGSFSPIKIATHNSAVPTQNACLIPHAASAVQHISSTPHGMPSPMPPASPVSVGGVAGPGAHAAMPPHHFNLSLINSHTQALAANRPDGVCLEAAGAGWVLASAARPHVALPALLGSPCALQHMQPPTQAPLLPHPPRYYGAAPPPTPPRLPCLMRAYDGGACDAAAVRVY